MRPPQGWDLRGQGKGPWGRQESRETSVAISTSVQGQKRWLTRTGVATLSLADDTGRAIGAVDGTDRTAVDRDGRSGPRGGGLPARRPIASIVAAVALTVGLFVLFLGVRVPSS